MKKRDFLLVALVLVITGVCWLIPRSRNAAVTEDEKMLKITVNGKEYGTYSMDVAQTVKINQTNTCEIKGGTVKMVWASCPDALCIHQGTADMPGETIVCLPNRVVLEVVAKDEEKQTDSLVQ